MAAGDIWLSRFEETTGTSTTTDAPWLMTPFGRTYSEGIIELSRKDRTANARLVIDIINKKKKFTVKYSEIIWSDLNELIYFYDSQINRRMYLVLTVEYTDTEIESYNVLMSPIDYERQLVTGDGLWRDITVQFEEL